MQEIRVELARVISGVEANLPSLAATAHDANPPGSLGCSVWQTCVGSTAMNGSGPGAIAAGVDRKKDRRIEDPGSAWC